MRAALLVVLGGVATPGAASAQDGRCAVASDCAVEDARCNQDGWCTLLQERRMFPNLSGLASLALRGPNNLRETDATPLFRWEPPTEVDLVAVALFRAMPRFDEDPGRISNFSDIIWVWHSNLPGASTADVQAYYEEGRGVREAVTAVDDEKLKEEVPRLEPGIYYWSAWAWHESRLSHAGPIRSLVIGGEDATGRPCSVSGEAGSNLFACDGVAPLRCVEGREYCVVACASDVDCYGDDVCEYSRLSEAHPWGVCRASMEQPCREGECESGRLCDEGLGICYQMADRAAACPACRSTGRAGLSDLLLLILMFFGVRRALSPHQSPSRRS